MRKLLGILGIIGISAIALAAWLPWQPRVPAQSALERDCVQPQSGDECPSRMRKMGDLWSSLNRLDQAERWYLEAAEQGDVVAMFHLGWIQQSRAIDATRGFVTAMSSQLEAAAGGALGDAYRLVTMSADWAIATHRDRAIEWYRKAADKGFAPAMNNLGQLYLLGIGREPGMAEAIRWHLAAARAGNPIGAWNVAIAYSAGHGVSSNAAESEKWMFWSPADVAPRDMASPTLERTTLFGSPLPAEELKVLRASWKAGVSVRLSLSSLPRDPSLPTFSSAASPE